MMSRRTKGSVFVWLLMMIISCLVLCSSVINAADDTADECKDDFQKVMTCLDFARGKVATPTKECCTSVEDIKEDDPKCLCYIIQQTHNGGDTIKSLGIQEGKLLQLSSACQIKNASITECPKLLRLSPSSPDAAIFTNASSLATPIPTTRGTPSSSSSSSLNDGSDGTRHGPRLVGPTVLIAVAIFLYAFPDGSASMFYRWG